MSAESIGRGWRRPDARIGVRNHVMALSTVALTDRLVQLAASRVPDVLTITPAFQRGLREPDSSLQQRLIGQLICHPNVGAVLVVTHDRVAAEQYRDWLATQGRPAIVIALMGCRGYSDAINQCVNGLQNLKAQAGSLRSEPMALSELSVALECGGSDATSAICANPAIGRFVDRLIDAGGRAIVSETAEFIGAEPVVQRQAETTEIGAQITDCIRRCESSMRNDGIDYRGVNPTAENIEAGLTTLIEKAMGAVSKIGTKPINGCLAFGQMPTGPGLYFMDTPFFSPVSITGMVSGGCQITLFAMGVFNPSGNPLTPTIKICGNRQTLANWQEMIDLDVSELLSGSIDLDQAASSIDARVRACTAGELTASEKWGEGQIIFTREVASL